ncbi:aminotransferase class I/II-fold pyridoxal phosphate-dependent enzyme [Massilia niabensis]|uniref:Aminotransferase class I/II-fold pyridoxal phosphate-dependent enzyme n=1 Tax=Massilia niabensis TaxID=544910 RepID=A0ABW0L3E2_9BURK
MLANPLPVRPLIPLAPILSASSFRRAGGARARTVLDAGNYRLVTSGRVAIALALREIGIKPGDEVLVPAYHSPSMIPPVLWRGARPVFYRVRPNAAVDLDDLAARITPATGAVMVTHYFGFPQEMAPIRALCDARGVQLIEDCAHCFIGEHGGRPVGAWGDYAIASSMKFLPVYEGGALVSARHSLEGVTLRSAGAGFEAKVALNSLERGFDYGRLKAVRAALWLPLRAKGALWGLVKRRRTSPAPALAPASSDSSFNFDPRWLDKRSSLFARTMLKLASPGRIQALRRSHYARLEEAIRDMPGVRALHPQLPDGACPWVFPLVASDPDALFARLKALGVPLTRFSNPPWQGVDAATCPNSAMLARQVLALPCHQELTSSEVAWLAARLREAASA